MKRNLIYILLFSLIFLGVSCSNDQPKKEKKEAETKKSETIDTAQPQANQNWIDIQAQVSRMNQQTSYDDITSQLGKPYEEYESPTLPEEYVLFYNVPGVKGAMFWIMLDSKTKTFLYWSGEKHEK